MSLKYLKTSLLFIGVVILTLGLSISFQSLLAAWTVPAGNPTTCATGDPGCDEPLNKSGSSQSKGGPLFINMDNNSSIGLAVAYGKVGIGTTNPTDKLSINSDDRATYLYIAGINDSTNNAAGLVLRDNTSGKKWSLIHRTVAGEANNFNIQEFDGSTYYRRLTIKPGGNVGIGTINATEKLTISAGANDRIGLNVDGVVSSIKLGSSLNGEAVFEVAYDRSSGDFILSHGQTGGELSQRLKIRPTSLDVISAIGTTYGRGIRLLDENMLSNSNHAIMFSIGKEDSARNIGEIYFNYIEDGSTQNYISFGLHSVPSVLNVVGTGNVGIGTITPAQKLSVAGIIESTTGGIKFPDGTLQTTAYINDINDNPRWIVWMDETNDKRTDPSIFTKSSQSVWSSYGELYFFINDFAQYSTLFEMKVYAPVATSITQKLYFLDDAIYCWLNGAMVYSNTNNGRRNDLITWQLVPGINTLQIVINNSGGDRYAAFVSGDFFYRYPTLRYVAP